MSAADYTGLIQASATQYGLTPQQLSAVLSSQQAFQQQSFSAGGLSPAQYIDGVARTFTEYLNSNNGNIANAVIALNGATQPSIAAYQQNASTILAAGGTLPPAANNQNGAGFVTPLTSTSSSQTTPGQSFLTSLKAGGWAAVLVILAAITLFFGVSGLIKASK